MRCTREFKLLYPPKALSGRISWSALTRSPAASRESPTAIFRDPSRRVRETSLATQPLPDQLSTDPQFARLTAIQTRQQAAILAVPGVQSLGITRLGGRLSFMAFGLQRTPTIDLMLPRALEGVPLYFTEIGGEITPQ
jgi:hypothetical protein